MENNSTAWEEVFDCSRVIFASLLAQTSINEDTDVKMKVLDELTQGIRRITSEMAIRVPVCNVQLISCLHTFQRRREEGVISMLCKEPRGSIARFALMLAPTRWACRLRRPRRGRRE